MELECNLDFLIEFSDVLRGRVGGFNSHSQDLEDHPDVADHWDTGTDIHSGNSTGRYDYNQRRLQMNAVLSHHARDFIFGSHDFRFGIEWENSKDRQQYSINGGTYYFDYFGAPVTAFMVSVTLPMPESIESVRMLKMNGI